MIEPFTFLIGVLVAYRLSLMFSKESGPAFVFRKLRRLPPPKSATKEGLSCQWCTSIYSAALVTLLLLYRGDVSPLDTPMIWLATSAGAIAMNQTWTNGD